MENTTMTNLTQITRVRFACPQIADRILSVRTVGVSGAYQGTGASAFGFGFGFGATGSMGGFGSDLRISTVTTTATTTFHAPMNKALAVKDVASLRSWSPPV